ncbi:MAG: PH domain-containing protein [Thermoanaerobaculia bacterium]
MSPLEELRFPCTADGVVAASQRRLGRMFALLGGALLAAAVFALLTRQIFAGGVALLLALGVFIIHRMSRELDPTELVVKEGIVSIFMRHALRHLPLEDSLVRRVTEDEIDHLAVLTSSGGFVAGAGGFDSHILGEFDLYASRLENAVLLETTDGRVIVTPDRPAEFIAAVTDSAATIPSP